MPDTTALARELDEARLARREIPPLTKAHGDFDLAKAYDVQRAGLSLRLGRGERVIGFKMGLTSAAKRAQMNLGAPIYGYLSDAMQVRGSLRVGDGIHPKIEPEIAFLTARELRGAVTRDEALAACGQVMPALEILDSRFVGFKYFSLPDVVADNCSSFCFVLGEPMAPRELAGLRMTLRVDGNVVQEADSNAISGHPVESLVQLCAMLAAHGEVLPAGSIVLAGAATVAVPLQAGMRIELAVEHLGVVGVNAV